MLCSLCIFECNETNCISLFGGDQGGESGHWKMIAKHMQIELAYGDDDNESKVICSTCAKRLEDFSDFCKFIEERQKCLIANACAEIPIEVSTLEDLYKTDRDLLIVDGVGDENKMTPLPQVKHEIPMEQEPLGIPDSNNDNDELQKFMTEEDAWDNSNDQEEDSSVNPISDDDECEESKPRRKQRKRDKIKKSKAISGRNKKTKVEDTPSSNDTKLSKHIAMTDELIAQNSSLRCDVCGVIEKTFLKLKSHYRSKHGLKGYVKCCGRIFSRRHHLCEHLNLHLNPSLYKCEICEKNLKTAYSYQKHMKDVHPKQEDLKFECDICGKKSASKLSAQLHREKHEGAKHTCNQCDKRFMTKYSLEYHVKSVHEQQINLYVCDTCGREYKSKVCFTLHVAEHKGEVPKKLVQCQICKDWVKRLDQHMQKHNHIDVECKMCGKIAASKSSLRSHIEKAHRNVVELPCSYCGKLFKSKKSLREHISMHTNTKDYKCQHCDREFRSSANMYAHIKRDHVEQWLQAQLARKKGPPPDNQVHPVQEDDVIQRNVE